MKEYYILSLKWTSGDFISWWGPNNGGYKWSLDQAGRYTQEQIDKRPGYYNDGKDTLAVPCETAEALAHRMVPCHNVRDIKKELGLID